MKTIRHLSNEELKQKLHRIERFEKRADRIAIECIAEIDSRKLYAKEAYPSLFEYLVGAFQYSAAKAQRRIDAARLLMDIPQVAKKIENGSLTVHQASQIQKAARTMKKLSHQKLSIQDKIHLMEKIENASQKQTEVIIAQELDLPVEPVHKEQLHRDESVTLTLTFSKDEMALLSGVKNMVSHSVPSHKWTEVILYLAQKEKTRRFRKTTSPAEVQTSENVAKTNDVKKTFSEKNSQQDGEQQNSDDDFINAWGSLLSPSRKPIKPSVRRHILNSKACCEYVDPLSQRKCKSRAFLQIDHRQPVWAGGSNDIQNLQTYCASHNSYKYQKQAGLLR